MPTQLFLIVSANLTIDELGKHVEQAYSITQIPVVLLLKGDIKTKEYEKRIKAILPITQKHQSALLLDNSPELVKKLGADGVHISSDVKKLRDAIKILKPELIVGAGNISSKDDAMTKGESGVDYVFFGDSRKLSDTKTHELALWWADTFEVPAVYFDEKNSLNDFNSANCEFVALPISSFQLAISSFQPAISSFQPAISGFQDE